MPKLKKSDDNSEIVKSEQELSFEAGESLAKKATDLEAKIAELEAKLGKLKDKEVEQEKEIHITKSKKEILMEKLRPLIEEETKEVIGRFRNFECPGGAATITVRKYPGIPTYCKVMNDGEIYTVPLYVARFLNGVDITAQRRKIYTCSYPVHGFLWSGSNNTPAPISKLDPHGVPKPAITVAKYNQRYGFESMAFDVNTHEANLMVA